MVKTCFAVVGRVQLARKQAQQDQAGPDVESAAAAGVLSDDGPQRG